MKRHALISANTNQDYKVLSTDYGSDQKDGRFGDEVAQKPTIQLESNEDLEIAE